MKFNPELPDVVTSLAVVHVGVVIRHCRRHSLSSSFVDAIHLSSFVTSFIHIRHPSSFLHSRMDGWTSTSDTSLTDGHMCTPQYLGRMRFCVDHVFVEVDGVVWVLGEV